LLLGTPIWTGEGWVGSFYPMGSKPADFLSFYATKFRTVEVDSTFYRIPTAHRQAVARTDASGLYIRCEVPLRGLMSLM
jgi:uncharacterized protein YecE (DUF72 family)